ncbi:HD-GYP domain-containing protein [Sphingoaurantiacus capsulatus]|uniref:HD-GYP domain-containing protein n=1 Tax=Sphingoaurantiacus capsulatus TaxID=1771310 RepID=A0ABV7X559_9SPHN
MAWQAKSGSDLAGQTMGVVRPLPPMQPRIAATATDFRANLNGHQDRVGTMAKKLAVRLGFDAGAAHRTGQAAALHDTGKLFLRRAMLEAPRALDAAEEAEVRTHTTIGHAALSRMQDPALALAAKVALQHHEAWDGGGYPYGLSGDAICAEARIVALCDVYDALRDRRPYKRAYSHGEAMAVLTRGDDRVRPSMFDPAVLEAATRDDGRFLDLAVRDAREAAAITAPAPLRHAA